MSVDENDKRYHLKKTQNNSYVYNEYFINTITNNALQKLQY